MGKPHKHAELIKAWADGAVIETKNKHSFVGWFEDDEPWWNDDDYEFRIKPEPKPDVVKMFQANYQCAFEVKPYDANLRLIWDGETGELKSAEVLK